MKQVKKAELQGLVIPVKYESGCIVDGFGRVIINANRTTGETPLAPSQRDALLQLVVELLNKSFEYDQADQILHKLGY